MNVIKAKLSHNAFIIQSIQPFSFEYNNTTIRVDREKKGKWIVESVFKIV